MKKIIRKYESLPVQLRASLWFLICSFLQKGISTLTTPIFTRLLSTAEYGQYNVFNSWMGIITVFVTLNLYYGVYTQGMVKFEDEKEQYSSALQGLTLALIICWFLVYLFGRRFWNNLFSLTTVQMIAMFAIMWATAVFGFWAAEQRIECNYKRLVALTLAVSLAKPLLGIAAVLKFDDKVTARIVCLAIVEVVCYFGLFYSQVARGKKLYVKKFWKHALMFNIPLIPHYLSQTVLNSADRIMISKMVDDGAAGIYSLAYSIALIMTIFNTALVSTMNPWIYKKIKEGRIADIEKIAYIGLFIIGGVNLALIVCAPEIVSIFAPPKYHEAIWVIPPIAMGVFFQFAYELFAKYEFYYEKTKYITLATTIGALLNIILNYVFISIFGYYAAGYTTLFCYILYALFHYFAMMKICQTDLNGIKPYNTKKLFTIMTGFVIAGFGLLLTYFNVFVRYGLIALVVIIALVNRHKLITIIQDMMNLRKEKA